MNWMDLAQPVHKAHAVCHSCRQRKKKCDKSLPKCALCMRFRRLCNYPDPDSSHTESGILRIGKHYARPSGALSNSSPRSRAANAASAVPPKTSFPPSYFLDFNLSRATLQDLRELPCVHSISVPPEIQRLVSTITARRNIASEFFGGLHHSFPFISKKTCYEKGLNPSMQSRVDVSLLFACMRLVQTPPPDNNPRTSDYLALKVAFVEAEIAGIATLRLLQAWILVAFYELGHAIYPSAYVSIGTCARYATALGLHSYEASDSQMPYMEVEEKKRTWWAIMILDRFVNIGCPERPRATRELQGNEPLPIDDTSWAQGDHEYVRPLTLSLPPSPCMGMFALLCLASNLLGLVQKAKTRPETEFRAEEKEVLDRAIFSLNGISLEEGAARDIGVCGPKSICYSARFLLNSQSRDSGRADNQFRTIKDVELTLSEELLALTRGNATGMLPNVATPFNIDSIYQAAATFTQLYVETETPGSFAALTDLKSTLRSINIRWKSAGAYLDLLEELEARCSSHYKPVQNHNITPSYTASLA